MPTRTSYHPSWKSTERFIWDCAVKGEIASLNKRDRYTCPVDDPNKWPDERAVSASFLETVLTEKKWKEAIHPRGLRIVGARFVDSINLSDRSIPFPLWLDASRFEAPFTADDLVVEGNVSFRFSHFAAPLSLHRGVVKKNFICTDATFQEVDLGGARIKGQLSFAKATVKGKLNMNGAVVGQHLFMREGATFQEVNLGGARIGGQLSFIKATVQGKLNMQRAVVEQHLFMREGATFQEVDLGGARIGGQLSFIKATVQGELSIERLEVGGDCLAHFLRLNAPLNGVGATFKGDLDFSGASFALQEEGDSCINLTGAKVGGELCFWQPKAGATTWDRTALILRNASCGALQDHPDGWPEVFDLTGFTYDRLGGLGGGAKGSIAHRPKEWVLRWLRRQADGETLLHYSVGDPLPKEVDPRDKFFPQTYEQLATVLEKEGMRELAKAVHIEKMERFREIATGRDRLWLTTIKYLINYGYSNWRPLLWAGFFWLIGVNVGLWYERTHSFPFDAASFSLDMLLPVVRMHNPHYDFQFKEWFFRWWFNFEQIAGYVLALFFAAGLTGLTKR